MTHLTFFLSAASGEFEGPGSTYPGMRTNLAALLEKGGLRPLEQGRFRQWSVDTLEKLAGYISESAVVVHVVGQVPGAFAAQRAVDRFLETSPNFLRNNPKLRRSLGEFRGITYTQWEAYLALHLGKPLFVYRTADAATNIYQKAHLDRLAKHAGRHATSPTPFETTEGLFGLVTAELLGDRLHHLHRLLAPRRVNKMRWAAALAAVILPTTVATVQWWPGKVAGREEGVRAELPEPRREGNDRTEPPDPEAAAKADAERRERDRLEAERLRALEDIQKTVQQAIDEGRRDREDRKKREEDLAAEAARKERADAERADMARKDDLAKKNPPDLGKVIPDPYVPPKNFVLCVFRTDGKSVTVDNGNQSPNVRRYYPGAGLGVRSRILPDGTIEADTIADGFGIYTNSKTAPPDLIVTVTLDGVEAQIRPASDPVRGSPGVYKHSYLAGALPTQGRPVLKAYVKAR
ncbi:MAG TPA: hypothetical protein VD866_30155 [Urbifossiella sp.]|nr:hypothetical protein [Urbifossiella sp.]